MHERNMLIIPCLYLLAFSAVFQDCLSAANHYFGAGSGSDIRKSKPNSATVAPSFGSSVVFPVIGNVYPKGDFLFDGFSLSDPPYVGGLSRGRVKLRLTNKDAFYHVNLNIGNPPKPYSLDIDTGSDLTWLQCDAPCTKCTPAPHSLYKPNKDLVTCGDPLCASLYWPADNPCDSPKEQCDYEVEYADQGSSMGVLVKDTFPMRFTNGSTAGPRLAFGCGYNQEVPDSIRPPFTDGVLGLGIGKSSIVGQLSNLGLTKNVVGHCLSAQGGFLFFGDDILPSSGIVWTPMLINSMEKHYSLGPTELNFDGQATGVKGLLIVFDSGSTYTYLSSQAYEVVLSLLKKNINGKQLKDANEDSSLPVCWKGSKPFKSIRDVKSSFKPLALSFTNSKNVQFSLPPEAYLIISDHGNVCLGILNGTIVGLGNVNVIGDVSLQDKLIIYDNEKQRIGWATAFCNKLPNIDDDNREGFCQPHAANLDILEGKCLTNLGMIRTSKQVDE